MLTHILTCYNGKTIENIVILHITLNILKGYNVWVTSACTISHVSVKS